MTPQINLSNKNCYNHVDSTPTINATATTPRRRLLLSPPALLPNSKRRRTESSEEVNSKPRKGHFLPMSLVIPDNFFDDDSDFHHPSPLSHDEPPKVSLRPRGSDTLATTSSLTLPLLSLDEPDIQERPTLTRMQRRLSACVTPTQSPVIT